MARRGRAVRASVLVPVAALTLAGCQWTSTVQTDKPYEPADGRSTTVGEVQLSNLLVVADKKGGPGTLVGAGSNITGKESTVSLAVADGLPVQLKVPAGGSARLSDPKAGKPATIPSVPVEPGAMVPVSISVDGAQETLQIPVVRPYAPYGDYSEGGEVTPTTHAETPEAAGGDH